MKKGLALVLSLCMLVAVVAVAGCDTTTPEQEGDTGQAVKLGLGSVTSIDKSRDAGDEITAMGQADTTIAAITLDADGKIVGVSIDTAQVQVEYDEDMQVASDVEAEIDTKKERGNGYGMVGQSDIGKEWYEQIAAFEEWMIGKTVEEVVNLDVKERDASHTHVPDVPELTSSVTITVESYIEAVEKAAENTIDVEDLDTFGLGHTISIAKSNESQAQMDITFATSGFDADNNVVGTIIDTAQVVVPFYADGKVDAADADLRTKKEKKEDYNMKGASDIDKEWYEQMEALEEWTVGKQISEIKNMPLVDDVPDVPELTSSVTVVVGSYLDSIFEAYTQAK